MKAVKAGEDPNASNPVRQEEWEDVQGEQGQVDQDVQAFDASVAQRAAQPSVEEAPDESFPQPSAPTSLPPVPHDIPPAAQNISTDAGQSSDLNLPSAPETFASPSTSTPNLPDTPAHMGAPQPAPSPIPPSNPSDISHDPSSFYNRPTANVVTPPPAQSPSGIPVVTRSIPQPAPVPAPAPAAAPGPSSSNLSDADDQSIALAQKHARWAVSALTFDDVNTAIKELKNSLRQLGAE